MFGRAKLIKTVVTGLNFGPPVVVCAPIGGMEGADSALRPTSM